MSQQALISTAIFLIYFFRTKLQPIEKKEFKYTNEIHRRQVNKHKNKEPNYVPITIKMKQVIISFDERGRRNESCLKQIKKYVYKYNIDIPAYIYI